MFRVVGDVATDLLERDGREQRRFEELGDGVCRHRRSRGISGGECGRVGRPQRREQVAVRLRLKVGQVQLHPDGLFHRDRAQITQESRLERGRNVVEISKCRQIDGVQKEVQKECRQKECRQGS